MFSDRQTKNDQLISSILHNEPLNEIKKYTSSGADGAHPDIFCLLITTIPCSNRLEKIVHLVEHCGADVNEIDRFGKTPLMYAFSVEIVNYLLNRGADTLAKDYRGKTVLMYLLEHLHTKENGKTDVFDTVLSKGSNPFHTDIDGNSASSILYKNKKYFSDEFICAFEKYLFEMKLIEEKYKQIFNEPMAIKSKRGYFLELYAKCISNQRTLNVC